MFYAQVLQLFTKLILQKNLHLVNIRFFFYIILPLLDGAHASYYCARNYMPVKSMQFLPSRKQGAPRRARHFLADKTCEFSPENSWVKIAWMQFLPAFRTSASAPFFHSLAPLPPSRTPPAVLQSGLGSFCKSHQEYTISA